MTTQSHPNLTWLPGRYSIGRFPAGSALVSVPSGPFVSITHSADELSLVCLVEEMPRGGRSEGPYALFRVVGSMELGLTGVIAALTAPLAAAGILVFTVATFDTDYVLVREGDRERAAEVLQAAGYRFVVPGGTG